MSVVAFFAAYNFIEFKIIGSPYFNAFIHACGSEIRLGRMEGDIINSEEMRRYVNNEKMLSVVDIQRGY